MQKVTLTALALAVAAGAGSWTLWRADTPDEPRRSPIARLAPDTRRVYEVELDTQVLTDGGQVGHYHLTGRWIVQATDTPGRVLTFVEEARFDSALAGPEHAAAMAAAGRELAAPLELAVDDRGLVREVRENPRVTHQARALAKAIAFNGQFSDATLASAWTGEEQDGTGVYEASYRRLARGRFERRKRAYRALTQASPELEGAGVDVEDSRHTFVFAADGHLASLTVHEKLAARGEYVAGLGTLTTMTLRFVGEEPARPVAVDRDALVVVGRARPGEHLEPSPEADAQRVAGQGFDELLGVLESLPPPDQRSDAQARTARVTFIALGARFRLDDASVDAALAAIEAGSPVSRTLWDALASAGTPRAQEALRTIIDMPRFSKDERRMQMVGLSLVHDPTRETVAFLHDRFDDPEQGTQARYGLGSAVYNLKSRRPEAAEEAYRVLVDELAGETDPARQAALLVALGNAGHAPALPLVKPYLGDRDDRVRRAAARALRQLPGAEVDALLAGLALDDRAETVRLAAVDVLTTREPTSIVVNALADAYADDASESVRKLAEQALDEWAARSPALAAQLERRFSGQGPE